MSLAFTREEFASRLGRLRARMRTEGLNQILLFGQDQMYYLTGYDQIGYSYYQVLIVRRDDETLT